MAIICVSLRFRPRLGPVRFKGVRVNVAGTPPAPCSRMRKTFHIWLLFSFFDSNNFIINVVVAQVPPGCVYECLLLLTAGRRRGRRGRHVSGQRHSQ